MSDLMRFTDEVYTSFLNLHPVWKAVLGGAVAYVGLSKVFQPVLIFFMKLRKSLQKKKEYDPSKIYLHVFPRKIAPGTLNLSPFGVKVETWLRLKKVNFELVETLKFSQKTHQIPYVMHGGEEISDSEQIIEYVSEGHEFDFTEGLSEEQQGAVVAFSAMMDELFVWTYVMQRYVFQFDEYKKHYLHFSVPQPFKYFLERGFPKGITTKLYHHGIGKKTEAQINQIAFKSLQAVSKYLGEKQFMMGDEMTKIDCVMFGHLSQIMFIDLPYPHVPFIKTYCTNLRPYAERIRGKLYPDWDDLVVKVNK